MRTDIRSIPLVAAMLLCLLNPFAVAEGKSSSKWRARAKFQPGYQSNVFKAPPSDSPRDDQTWNVGLDTYLRYRFNDRFMIQLKPEFKAELYRRHTQRNQTKKSGGVRLEFTPSNTWTFRVDLSTNRSNRDLIGDAGEFTGRTLSKWTHEILPRIRFNSNRFQFSVQYERRFVDYDEQVDDTGKHKTSYDYGRDVVRSIMQYKLANWLKIGFNHEREWRDYTERVTLSMDKKRSEIRSFSEHTTDVDATVKYNRVHSSVGYRFTKRTDIFENFYGYDYNKMSAVFGMRRMWRSKWEFSFSYAEKNYPNYWTSRIGDSHRVAIQYRDWRFDWVYPVTRLIDIELGMRRYVKTSNDRNFNYRQTTILLGAKVSFGS